jgi:hypothetical protein
VEAKGSWAESRIVITRDWDGYGEGKAW